MEAPASHYVVLVGSKTVACYTGQTEADALKTALTGKGATAVSVVPTTPGVNGDTTQTLANYLLGADAIVTEAVAVLSA